MLAISFFKNLDLVGTAALVKCQFFHKLILGVLSSSSNDVLIDVIGVTSKYSADSVLSNRQSNFA